ncbi:hypothetical protein [Halomonas organivorans]|uniref:DUF4148 domain-containing protein n=1 Tax=Halomonas organivorans TaxID=257772 RepID=A0A7W5G5S4_9GAMM|nr:hypothetical protein [Halomonas organivorans]MBB3141410.1 hypothetical protein [Halomonas organivorans]
MKLKLITASLLLAALPLAAQADPATERALQLHQESLSTAPVSQDTATDSASRQAPADWGGSEAMAQARLRLNAQPQATQIVASDDAIDLARQATQG